MAPPNPRHAAIDADGIATLAVPGEKSLNIVGTPVIGALTTAIDALASEPALRVLVLRGSRDGNFIGGADIGEMAALTPQTAREFIVRLKGLCDALQRCPVPVIARLAGWCLGGGLEVAMACDLRIADADTRLGMPEVRVGIPSVIHAALLPRLVGRSLASWMLLTGETIDAERALAHGLVHRVCAAGELDAAVMGTARELAALGPAVLRQQKALLAEWDRLPLQEAIERSVDAFAMAFTTGEPQLHMGRFLTRRRP